MSVQGGLSAGQSAALTLKSGAGVSLGELQIGGALALAAAGAVSQSGDLKVMGAARIEAGPSGAVVLDRTGNDFGGTVSVKARSATLGDRNALSVELDLAAGEGPVAASALVADGALSLAGRVAGTQATLTAASRAGDVSAGALSVEGSATVSSGSGQVQLGALSVGGDLVLKVAWRSRRASR